MMKSHGEVKHEGGKAETSLGLLPEHNKGGGWRIDTRLRKCFGCV